MAGCAGKYSRFCDLLGDWHRVARGAFLCRAHFGDDAWPADGRTRTGQWNCAPSSVSPHPVGDSLSSTRTGAASLAAFWTLNGPLRDSQSSKRQVRDAPEARSGVVAGAGAVAKRRPVPIGGSECGGVGRSCLTRPSRARHALVSYLLFCSMVSRSSRRGGQEVPNGRLYLGAAKDRHG